MSLPRDFTNVRLFALIINSCSSSKWRLSHYKKQEQVCGVTRIRPNDHRAVQNSLIIPAAAQIWETALISNSVRSHLPLHAVRCLRVTVQILNVSAEPQTDLWPAHRLGGDEHRSTVGGSVCERVSTLLSSAGLRSDKLTAPFLCLIRFLEAICWGMEVILWCEETPAKNPKSLNLPPRDFF